jgi:hypothetical protein
MACHSDSGMPASVCDISGILVLRRPPFWCTLKFTASFYVWYSTVHTRCREENFPDINSAKQEITVNTVRKVKSAKFSLFIAVSFRSLNTVKTWCRRYRLLAHSNLFIHWLILPRWLTNLRVFHRRCLAMTLCLPYYICKVLCHNVFNRM